MVFRNRLKSLHRLLIAFNLNATFEVPASRDRGGWRFGDGAREKTRFGKTPLRQSVVTVENRFVDGIAGSLD